jgi:hypothetical protein
MKKSRELWGAPAREIEKKISGAEFIVQFVYTCTRRRRRGASGDIEREYVRSSILQQLRRGE